MYILIGDTRWMAIGRLWREWIFPTFIISPTSSLFKLQACPGKNNQLWRCLVYICPNQNGDVDFASSPSNSINTSHFLFTPFQPSPHIYEHGKNNQLCWCCSVHWTNYAPANSILPHMTCPGPKDTGSIHNTIRCHLLLFANIFSSSKLALAKTTDFAGAV